MSAYKVVYMSFWTDAKVADDFSIEERYLYLYLFTNPHTSLCGCYEISLKQHISIETGYTVDKITKLIERLSNIHKVIKYCPETREVLIVNWYKYNWTDSPRFKAALKKEVQNIKCPEFKAYLTALVSGEDTVYSIQDYGIDPTDTDNDLDTDDKPAKKSTAFVPPTVEEVRAYCRERKNNIDADSFVNFYQSKGWMVGKSKMKDWQACVRTWEKNENSKGGGTARQQTTPKVANQFSDFPQRDKSEIDFAELERRKSGFK